MRIETKAIQYEKHIVLNTDERELLDKTLEFLNDLEVLMSDKNLRYQELYKIGETREVLLAIDGDTYFDDYGKY